MRNFFRQLFSAQENPPEEIDAVHAAASLMFEVIWADHQINDAEIDLMCDRLQSHFQLPRSEIDALVARTRTLHEASVGIHEYTRLINDTLDGQMKKELLETMWRLAFVDRDADSQVHPLEEHAIRRIADLLYVPHKDFIATKRAARDD